LTILGWFFKQRRTNVVVSGQYLWGLHTGFCAKVSPTTGIRNIDFVDTDGFNSGRGSRFKIITQNTKMVVLRPRQTIVIAWSTDSHGLPFCRVFQPRRGARESLVLRSTHSVAISSAAPAGVSWPRRSRTVHSNTNISDGPLSGMASVES